MTDRLQAGAVRVGLFAVLVGLVAGGCSGASSGSPAAPSTTSANGRPAPGPGALHWRVCDEKFRCARLVVPLDDAQASAGTISLAVVELPATGHGQVGDLVLNPGGPGGSGVQFLEGSVSAFPAALRARFNLVSFDPRGVGESAPVRCASGAALRAFLALDPAPTTPAAVAAVEAATRRYVAGCVADTPIALLEHVSTADTANDLDRLRAALGQAKLDYLGFSYGTYLGTLYAERFASHVGRFVLDGAVDPSLSTAATEAEQGAGFEVDLRDFFAWCSADKTCDGEVDGRPQASLDEVVDKVRSGDPLTAELIAPVGGTQAVTYGDVEYGVASALYSSSSWPYLGQAIGQALSGNGDVFAELAFAYAGINANGTSSNELAAETAIGCVDRPSPTSVAAIEALADRLQRTEPDFGAIEAWGSLNCLYWPVRPEGAVAPAHLAHPLPIVVVGSTDDPATPYAWAQALTRQLAGAVLLTRRGSGHTGYLNSSCVRSAVDRFFLTGKRPAPGTVCSSAGG